MSAISNCKLCLHWSPDLEVKQIKLDEAAPGYCHRFPPVVVVLRMPQGLQIRTQFPQPLADFWCGEFSPRESH